MDYQGLVKKLIERGYLKTPLVIDAFKNINRADFVPDELKDEAGDDWRDGLTGLGCIVPCQPSPCDLQGQHPYSVATCSLQRLHPGLG